MVEVGERVLVVGSREKQEGRRGGGAGDKREKDQRSLKHP